MKIEKLTDNKIRIIFNIEDLDKKNINIHSLVKNSEDSQKFFRKILKQAQKEVNFVVDDSKLLIEAFISTEGFFVLTFTKIKEEPKTRKKTVFNNKNKYKKKTLNPNGINCIYSFENFDDFCDFCTYINSIKISNLKDFAKNISLYEYNNKYFLAFSQIDKNYKDKYLLTTLISEFACLTSNSSCFISELNEYGKTIFKNNAIQNGIKYLARA